MKLNQLHLIEEGIKRISSVTDTDATEIIEALTGVAWDEEDAGSIREHLIRLGWTPPDEHALSQPAEGEGMLDHKAYAGCTIWRGSLRVSVIETAAIERRIDADDAFFYLVQRALDSLAGAWDAAALKQEKGQ